MRYFYHTIFHGVYNTKSFCFTETCTYSVKFENTLLKVILTVQLLYGHHYWGEPERAPPRALQRLRSLSHNNENISYVLAPVYKRLYFIRDVTYISRPVAGPHATRKRKAGSLKVQRSPKSGSRTNTFTSVSSWLCGSASHRLALIIVWQLATLLKEVRTISIAL